jgi:hypothetical protein
VYRPGHPLAQSILGAVKQVDLPLQEIVFDYSNHQTIISILQPLVGNGGVLKISNYTIDSFENEDHLLLSGVTADGKVLETDVLRKLFSLKGMVSACDEFSPEEQEKISEVEQQHITRISGQIAERNSTFFDDEVDKLDKWSNDMKMALELDLKKLDIDIKIEKTNAKKILDLEKKVEMQRAIKEMEKKRNEMRHKLYQAQDEVDTKKEQLLERVEARLKQQSKIDPLFSIRWSIV